LTEAFPYLILDARYERAHEAGVIVSQAVLIAIGIDWGCRRESLPLRRPGRWRSSSPIARADRAGGTSCWDQARGPHGVEFVVADDHVGLRAALREALAEAAYQRCYAHFLRNPLDYIYAGSTITACRGCAGFMTVVTTPRRGAISPPWLA
jgi:putative transposase